MRKILTAALAALTIGGAVASTATPAAAHEWGGGGWRGGGWHGGWHGGGWRGDDAGLAVGAGLLGLAVGASLAPHDYYYGPRYYAPAPVYYGGPGYYGYYGGCRVHYRWDPYAGRYFPVERCY